MPGPNGKRTKLTPHKLGKIQSLHAQVISSRQIAEAVGLSSGYVRQVIRAGLQPPQPRREPAPHVSRPVRHRKLTAPDIQLLRQLVQQQQVSRVEIARRLGISRTMLYRLIPLYCGEIYVSKKPAAEHVGPSSRMGVYALPRENWGHDLEHFLQPRAE